MKIQLLKNTANTKSFNRNFVKSYSFDCVLKEGSDVLSPSIILETGNMTDYNEMYIPDFKRYYFIGWENISNSLWRAYAKEIDVLYTYKASILGLNAIIDKQEYLHNDLLDDGSYVKQVNTMPEVQQFSGGFEENPSNILVLTGASVSSES